MSLFLIYFEIGKPVPPLPWPTALYHFPISMTFKGRQSQTREATVLTDGHSSEAFVAFEGGYKQEGLLLRKSLFDFIHHRIAAGAHPHLVFYWLGGKVEAVSVDVEHVARVPITKLEDKLRALERFRIVDSSEVMEVTSDIYGYEEQVHEASHVVVDLSVENATSEPDPMQWTGNVDMLIDKTLFRLRASNRSLLLLPSFQTMAEAVGRFRRGARTFATRLAGDTAPLRFIRKTSGGIHAAIVAYRGLESTPVPVSELDAALGDAVCRFLSGLRPEQRALLGSGQAAKVLETIALIWPEVASHHAGG